MGLLDSILGGKKQETGPSPDMAFGGDAYGMYSQGIDPGMVQLLNAPGQGGNAQIAQFAIDNDEIIETVKAELRGFRKVRRFDMEQKKEVEDTERFGEPVMNDMGINETCRILRMFLSKPFLLSNFPKEDRNRIDMMMKILWKKLASKYTTHCEVYALDRGRRSDIAFSIVCIVYMNIMRSYEDGERPRMYGSHKTVQTINDVRNASQQQNKKFLGIFG